MEEFAPEYDAMINLVGVGRQPLQTQIGAADVFEQYASVQNAEITSNMILTHMATSLLTPNGYIGLPGCFKTFIGDNHSESRAACMDNIMQNVRLH